MPFMNISRLWICLGGVRCLYGEGVGGVGSVAENVHRVRVRVHYL